MPVVRTDGLRAYGHLITKISRMGRLANFLTHGDPLRALLARGAPLLILSMVHSTYLGSAIDDLNKVIVK